jgi:predicted nuclease of predicted toxin-antitoxin system
MRFLVDECTGPAVAKWLRQQGYEVFSVYEQVRGIGDDDLVEKTNAENRILITNDKDFGEKIYRDNKPHKVVILLHLDDERVASKIAIMQQFLKNHLEQLENNFIVVTESRVRIAKK